MRTEVFQMQVVKFDDHGNLIPKRERTIIFVKIGEIDGSISANDLELVWELANHSCWMSEECCRIELDGRVYYPTEHDKGYANDDICFKIEDTWFASDSCGWSEFDSIDSAKKHFIENSLMIIDALR